MSNKTNQSSELEHTERGETDNPRPRECAFGLKGNSCNERTSTQNDRPRQRDRHFANGNLITNPKHRIAWGPSIRDVRNEGGFNFADGQY